MSSLLLTVIVALTVSTVHGASLGSRSNAKYGPKHEYNDRGDGHHFVSMSYGTGGVYKFAFELPDQHREEERNDEGEVRGSYSFRDPEGELYSLQYLADKEGFKPVADHLPVAPEETKDVQEARKAFQEFYEDTVKYLATLSSGEGGEYYEGGRDSAASASSHRSRARYAGARKIDDGSHVEGYGKSTFESNRLGSIYRDEQNDDEGSSSSESLEDDDDEESDEDDSDEESDEDSDEESDEDDDVSSEEESSEEDDVSSEEESSEEDDNDDVVGEGEKVEEEDEDENGNEENEDEESHRFRSFREEEDFKRMQIVRKMKEKSNIILSNGISSKNEERDAEREEKR